MRTSKWDVFGLKTGQRRDIRANVTTFQRVSFPTSRHSGQLRDVPEDINNQRHDVPERCKINVATLDINVTTFQRMVKINIASLNINVATFQRV